jgi:HEAT repeat protein
MEQVREAAASALGELGSADEITKHSMCAALSASSKSVVTEAAAALQRLFPPGKWSDGLDSLDLDLVGTLALLG